MGKESSHSYILPSKQQELLFSAIDREMAKRTNISESARALLDRDYDEGTQGNPDNVVAFPQKESSETLISQHF